MNSLCQLTRLAVWSLLMTSPVATVSAETQSVPKWQELRTVEDVCTRYPELMHQLLQALDLHRPGLEAAEKAYKQGQLESACEAVLTYYRDGNSASWLRREAPEATEQGDASADELISDRFVFYGQVDIVPRRQDGGLEWNHTGPSKDREWAWALNRQSYLRQLVRSYFGTGNPKYAQAIDAILRDWVVHGQPYPKKRSGTCMWRGLEIHFRAKVWSELFISLQASKEFLPATRLLVLQSLVDHADYLRRFHSGANWLTMELSGLAAIATRLPEFKASRQNLEYAGKVLGAELSRQVYPDGAQMELTASYHWVALTNFEQYSIMCEGAGVPVPAGYEKRLVDMYDYLAGIRRPDGAVPLNNDADRNDYRKQLLAAADRYGRPTWRYIATNGKQGEAPAGLPSRIYPYAGHLVSRNGWGRNAQWSFFDVGPWGIGHQHTDKLHLSVHVAGRDLLVDSGRFAYQGDLSPFRSEYGRRSRAHNVVLFDDLDQVPNQRSVKKPLSEGDYAVTDAFDYARGSVNRFQSLKQGDVTHTRVLLYVRGQFWVVVDRLKTKGPRKVTTLWHWHPDCTVTAKDGRVFSTDQGKMNLSVQAVGDTEWTVRMVRGFRRGSEFQGWYSERYNSVEKNWTALCDTRLNGQATYVWLLVPGQGDVPVLAVPELSVDEHAVGLAVDLSDGCRCTVSIPVVGPANEAKVRFTK